MKIKLLTALIAALPAAAYSAGNDAASSHLMQQLQALQQEVQALQQSNAQIPLLKQQIDALQQQVGVAAPGSDTATTPVAADADSDEPTLKQTVTNLQIKVDTLNDAAASGPIAGLSVTGYVDPMYLYNRDQQSGGFRFLNKNGQYNYYDSNLGDTYIDIKKTFGVGPMAPDVELVLMPDRGGGGAFTNENGTSSGNIFNQANVALPLNTTSSLMIGLLPSLAGYEPVTNNTTKTLTHNLLYDFSEPATYIGGDYKWFTNNYQTLWQVMLANEQQKSAGSVVSGTNNTSQSNRTPTLAGRVDYQYTTSLDLGFSANLGRQTLYSPCAAGGYGYQCNGDTPFGTYVYAEGDLTYTWSNVQYNAQLDYGQLQHGAWNGGTAQWYGVSLLANKTWNTDWVGKMGASLRYDYLNDSKNGGGGAGIAYGVTGSNASINANNGFGVDQQCLNASTDNGQECKGTNRSDVALDLQFFPTDKIIIKVEYRHDIANNAVFLKSDGTLSKNNDLIGTQFIYSF